MGAVYTQLSLQERRKIEDWWHAKVPVREMARVLRRHKSTIFREIKRNFWADESLPKNYAGYFGHAAQLQTQKRRKVQRKLIRHPELCSYVVQPKSFFAVEALDDLDVHPEALADEFGMQHAIPIPPVLA